MRDEKQVERLRGAWEELLLSGKLEICSEELKGASILDVNILRLLFRDPEIIPKTIAGTLGIPNSTLTNAINRLEKNGLVERRLSTRDLRSLQLILTDKGNHALLDHHKAEREKIVELFGVLDEAEAESLIAVLEKITACL